MKEIFCILFLLFIGSAGFSITIEIELYDPGVVIPANGDIFRYGLNNVFDGDTNTALALRKARIVICGLELSTNWLNMKYFSKPVGQMGWGEEEGIGRVGFGYRVGNYYFVAEEYNPLALSLFAKSNILIDEIRIYNGYQKNREVFYKNNRIKDMVVFWYSKEEIEFPFVRQEQLVMSIGGGKSRTNAIITLEDRFGAQILKFKKPIKGGILFYPLSVYPGTTYDDTCISEIEFWYQGQKYEVANLEEAKREFVRKVREKARWGVGDPYDTETYIKESGPEVERRLAGYGITNVEVLDMTGKMDIVGKRASVIRVRKWVPAEGKGYRMVLYAQKKGSGLKKRKVTTTDAEADVGEYEYELREVVKIGEAKVDENGTTWAKLGNSEWRAVVITSGYGRMLMSDYFEAFGIGDVDSEGHVAPFPEE